VVLPKLCDSLGSFESPIPHGRDTKQSLCTVRASSELTFYRFGENRKSQSALIMVFFKSSSEKLPNGLRPT